MLAYADVANAWRTYLAQYNKGRPFVLIGHSQGSLMLQQLIKNEIEGKPVAQQMRLAILPGYNLLVPQGKRVGGTLKIDARLRLARRDRLRDDLGQLPREQRRRPPARSSALRRSRE